MGVVYHGRLLDYYEEGRTVFLRRIGRPYRQLESQGVFLPVVRAALSYRAPARYDDELEVRTRLVHIGSVTARFQYGVRRPSDGVEIAAGETLHACIDRQHKPHRLPQALRDRLRAEILPPEPPAP